VAALSAVHPDRLGVIDLDGERRGSGRASTDGHEPGVESHLTRGGSQRQLPARYSERRLGGGMVCSQELEGDSVSWVGSDVGGCVDKPIRSTDGDDVIGRGGGGR